MKENSKPVGNVQLVDVKPTRTPVISISRSEVAFKPGMVSRATQTGGDGDQVELMEKRRLIRKQLAVLLHAVLCRVRDELLGNTGEDARPCPTAFCALMKGVLRHLNTCGNLQSCTLPHCISSRKILGHWTTCTQTDCPICSSLRREVPAYLESVVQNPRWRQEIWERFRWLITFVRLANFEIPTSPITPTSTHVIQQPQRSEEEHETNNVKNSEE